MPDKYLPVPRLVVAGISSGCGKTTIAAGLMSAWRARGLTVQGFKVGPDYIDPSYHTLATGRPCRNLDSWMLGHDAVREIFLHGAGTADISIIEGVMGLFDGHGGVDDSGSTAEVAKILQAPVILALDVSKLSRSAAAIVLGCLHFDPELNIRGVIINRAGSPRHFHWVKEAIEQNTRLPVLGHLPRRPDLALPERHLGLVPAAEQTKLESFFDQLVRQTNTSIDTDAIIRIARKAPPLQNKAPSLFSEVTRKEKVPIGIARDQAFSFYYQDNLELLEAHGAKLVYFSPLRDAGLPLGIQGIYFGGGFPEIYALQLSENASMRQAIRKAGLDGMAIYAECGGLMYLAEGIVDLQANKYPMVGLVPGWSSMLEKRLKLGYVTMKGNDDNPLLEGNSAARGHEFHYSNLPPSTFNFHKAAWWVLNHGQGTPEPSTEGFRIHNIIASYVHLHFASHRSLAPNFVAWCARSQGLTNKTNTP